MTPLIELPTLAALSQAASFLSVLPGALWKAAGVREADPEALSNLSLEISGVGFSPEHLERYRRICQFLESAGQGTAAVPLPYPQVVTFPAQIAVLTDKSFPLPVLGAIHVGQKFWQAAPLALSDSPFSVRINVGNYRAARKGIEFDLRTQLFDAGGTLVWAGLATYLSKVRSKRRPEEVRSTSPAGSLVFPYQTRAIAVPPFVGDLYATISGDTNPIHGSRRWQRLLGRIFGQKRPIAHGMWTGAATLATLPLGSIEGPVEVALRFVSTLPYPLSNRRPGTLEVSFDGEGTDRSAFQSVVPGARRPVVEGVLTRRSEPTPPEWATKKPS